MSALTSKYHKRWLLPIAPIINKLRRDDDYLHTYAGLTNDKYGFGECLSPLLMDSIVRVGIRLYNGHLHVIGIIGEVEDGPMLMEYFQCIWKRTVLRAILDVRCPATTPIGEKLLKGSEAGSHFALSIYPARTTRLVSRLALQMPIIKVRVHRVSESPIHPTAIETRMTSFWVPVIMRDRCGKL